MNIWLKENGHWCADCHGTGRGRDFEQVELIPGWPRKVRVKCPSCAGIGRLPGPGPDRPAPRYSNWAAERAKFGIG